ncbi:MAG: hypothetical protein Q7U47_01315 [Paludibacter sp.]|nr:hypothetical protein [Paludibacter sp.]
MNKLVSGAIGVEIHFGLNPAQKIYFPDVIDLRKKRIKHIDICLSDTLTKSPTNKEILGTWYQTFLTATFVESNTQNELIKDMPLDLFQRKGYHLFINKIIDFQKSYINLSGTEFNILRGKSIYFVFWYDEPAVWGYVGVDNKISIQPIEIKLKGLKTYFSENLNLRGKRYSNLLLSFPQIVPSGNAGISDVSARSKLITLNRKGLNFFYQVPLYLLYQTTYNYQYRLQNIQFDFENSYIESLNGTVDDLQSIFLNAIIDETASVRR